MPQPVFQFVTGAVAPRAMRIPDGKWEKHRAEVCRLYLSPTMRLEDVMNAMQENHRFYASVRQYTHQLKKWGVKKNGTVQSEGHSLPVADSHVVTPDKTHSEDSELSKRPRSVASIQTTSSCGSKDTCPTRKRGKVASANVSTTEAVIPDSGTSDALDNKDAGADVKRQLDAVITDIISDQQSCTLNRGFTLADIKVVSLDLPQIGTDHTAGTSPISNEGGAPAVESATAKSTPVASLVPGDTDVTVPIPVLTSFPPTQTTLLPDKSRSLRTSIMGMRQSLLVPSIGGRSTQNNEAQIDANLPPTSVPTRRTIDRDEPVDNFSIQDIADLQRAADYFSVFCYNQEAFELYTIVLKRQISDPLYRRGRESNFWYLVIQCAHNAVKREHCEIIQNILQAELHQFRPLDYIYNIYNFILHMLLAFVYYRKASRLGIEENIYVAKTYYHDSERLMNQLPPEDRSMDLVLYRNILRIYPKLCDLLSLEPFEFKPFTSYRSLADVYFEDLILFRKPGPFEVEADHTMANPCIKSCLSWCDDQLQSLTHLPIPRGTCEYAQNSKVALTWAEANALFRIMWQRWCTLAGPEHAWMTETQSKMGISPSDLLLLVCRAIHQANLYGWIPASSEHELIARLRESSTSLLAESGLHLARRVLKQYVARNTATAWPEWRSAVRKSERQQDVGCLENALRVSFPNLGIASRTLVNSMLFAPDETVLQFKDVEFVPKRHLTPTLASSLSSVDMSSFRRTGARAEKAVRKLLLGRRSSIPSTSQIVDCSAYNFSVTSLGDLSMSLGSLSLSRNSQAVDSSRSWTWRSGGLPKEISEETDEHEPGG